jgi:hypothetical protein
MPRASQLDPAVARRLPPVSYELVIGVSALLGLLGLMYGGVGARGQVVLWGGAALLALVTAGRWVLGKGAAWSWVMLLPLGFVGLVALQGFGLLGFESGDPHATRVEMGRLLAVTALFGVMLPLSSRSRRRVLLGMAGAGALAVGVALLQMLMGEHSILGVWPLPQRSSYSGPFVHYGHFAQFVNLSIGAALGFLLWRVRARRPGQELRARDLLGHAGERGAVEGWLWAFVLVAMVTIAVSMSRNGVVSMLVAGAVTTALLQRGRVARGLGWPIAALALLAVGVLMVVGFDPVYERMSTLGEIGAAYEGRGALLMDTLSGWLERPVLGHGQGAFEVAFPMYDSSMRGGTAAHAENQYAELLFEGGVLGFGLIAGFGLLVLRAWRHALRGEGSDVYVYGLGFGLIAVAFHAGTDFGLRIPAVAAMTMVAAGLIVGATARPVQGMVGRVAGAGLWLGMALLLGLQLPGAFDRIGAEDAARQGEELRARVLADGAGRGTAAEYRELLSLYETAVRLEPGEIEHAYWAAVYRWQGRLAELMEAGAGTGTDTGTRASADRPAAAATLTVDELERLRVDPELLEAAERAIAELRAASELAPSWGPALVHARADRRALARGPGLWRLHPARPLDGAAEPGRVLRRRRRIPETRRRRAGRPGLPARRADGHGLAPGHRQRADRTAAAGDRAAGGGGGSSPALLDRGAARRGPARRRRRARDHPRPRPRDPGRRRRTRHPRAVEARAARTRARPAPKTGKPPRRATPSI